METPSKACSPRRSNTSIATNASNKSAEGKKSSKHRSHINKNVKVSRSSAAYLVRVSLVGCRKRAWCYLHARTYQLSSRFVFHANVDDVGIVGQVWSTSVLMTRCIYCRMLLLKDEDNKACLNTIICSMLKQQRHMTWSKIQNSFFTLIHTHFEVTTSIERFGCSGIDMKQRANTHFDDIVLYQKDFLPTHTHIGRSGTCILKQTQVATCLNF